MNTYTEDELDGFDILDGPQDNELVDEDIEDDFDDEADDADYDSYAAIDDRYEGNGIPSWSAWA